MAPPKWLVKYWDEEPDWVKRYIQGSFELNGILCGIYVLKDETMWTPDTIRQFVKHMNSIGHKSIREGTLYRGSGHESPTMQDVSDKIYNCQFMSTTKSRKIAREFAGKDGYIHVFHIMKGVTLYDLEATYGDDGIKREQEVIIYPGAVLTLIKRSKNTLYWNVSPN